MYGIKLNKDNNVDDRLEKKLYEHESKLVKVETILERVAINQDKMAEAVAQISTSIIKQELILEKLSHLETNAKGSFERVHNRIDKVCTDILEMSVKLEHSESAIYDIKSNVVRLERKDEEHDDKFVELELFTLIKKYPVVTILIGLGIFSLTFDPISESLASVLSLFM